MGIDAPFIYDRPNSWNFAGPTDRGFNPKAATQASWTAKPATPKKDGPLVDFNKHPDSYLIVPYGNLTTKPMHPNTRMRVKRGRQFQLFLRACGLLGAMGLLFCCIAINKTSRVIAWIIRVAPAVALIHNTYGLYHLCRAATGRPPASSASYMLFAAMLDTALIPFMAFTSYLSYLDWSQNRYGWSTLFNDSEMSYKIIFAFFVLSTAVAGLMFLSLIMDIYLATIFRKIAKMPPDMNPLEPNLTSRYGQKHKRNKSSMNVTEKHMSASTLVNVRDSAKSGRRIPFIHTRTDSGDSVTLYANESARNSRISMRKGLDENKNDPYLGSNNNSRVTLAPTRPTSAINPAENSRTAGAGLNHRPARSSGLASSSPTRSPDRSSERPSSWLSYLDYEGVPTPLSDTAAEQLDQEVRPMSPVSALSSRDPSLDQTRQVGQHERQNWYQGFARNSHASLPPPHNASTHDLNSHLAPPHNEQLKKRSREPLGMNPPSPLMAQGQLQDENLYTPGQAYGALEPSRDALTPTDGNVQRTSRPSSFIGSGGKSRFYGNLRASLGSVGAEQRVGKNADSDIMEIYDDGDYDPFGDRYGQPNDQAHEHGRAEEIANERTPTMQSASDYSGNIEVYASDSEDEGTVSALNVQHLRLQQHQQQQTYNAGGYSPTNANRSGVNVNIQYASPTAAHPPASPSWNGARQTSNSTSHDVHGGYAGLGKEFGVMSRRREVSGKVAEEGRGDGGYGHQEREREEETTPKKKGMGASAGGWARFKGL